MAAKLECEICGGKLVGKPGGVFECDSCGMEYSTEWAKQKIQEIKGTVKVEGTVEVTGKVQVEGGTVKVEGTSSKESLLKRAKMCCADKDWGKAKELLEQVLNADPECAEAYLYRYLADRKQPTLEALFAASISHFVNFPTAPDLEKAAQFADEALTATLNQYRQKCADAIEADKKHRQTCIGALAEKRKALEPVQHLIAYGEEHIVGLRSDGTVLATGEKSSGQCDVSEWRDVISVACGKSHTVGLRVDGTVIAVGYNGYGRCDVSEWRDIVSIACGREHTVGLRRDGTVVAAGRYHEGQCNVEDWTDIVSIACIENGTVGLRRDGTVVYKGEDSYDHRYVEEWTDIVEIVAAGDIFGIRSDGTAIITSGSGYDREFEYWKDTVAISQYVGNAARLCMDGTLRSVARPEIRREAESWRDLVSVCCCGSYPKYEVVGLRADGPAVDIMGLCDSTQWRDLVMVTGFAFGIHENCVIGLRRDGTVIVAKTENARTEFHVEDWKLFDSLETLTQKRAEMKQRAERAAEEARLRAEREAAEEQKRREARKAALAQERAALQAELANLKGLFNGKRRKELEARLAEIDNEWKTLA